MTSSYKVPFCLLNIIEVHSILNENGDICGYFKLFIEGPGTPGTYAATLWINETVKTKGHDENLKRKCKC